MSVINCSKLVVSPGDPLRMSSCGYNFGAQCNFSCPTSYRLNGSSSLKCVAQSDSPPGVWDNRLPTCYGTFCRWIYFCSILIAPSPFPSIRLKHNFFFFAAITCPSLPIPKHGQKVGCIDPVWEPYDTHCSFACQAGYSLLGSSVRRCLQNSTWSGVASSCQGKELKGPYAQETRHPLSSRWAVFLRSPMSTFFDRLELRLTV